METAVIVLGIAAAIAVTLLLISQYERNHPKKAEYTVFVKDLPEGFDGYRILYLTDLHAKRFGEENRRLLSLIEDTPADLVLFGGDMATVKKRVRSDFDSLREITERIPKDVPIFYGLGNHEGKLLSKEAEFPDLSSEFRGILSEGRIRLLDNESVPVERNGDRIFVSGLSLEKRYYRKRAKEELTEETLLEKLGKRQGTEILLVHTPQYLKEISKRGPALVLSGHYHGGTIRLGTHTGLMTPQFRLFDPYCHGEYHFGDTTAVVSSGLGTNGVHIRLNDRPEIVSIVLRRKEDHWESKSS